MTYHDYLTRRWFLKECGVGLGTIALHALLQDRAVASQATSLSAAPSDPLAPRLAFPEPDGQLITVSHAALLNGAWYQMKPLAVRLTRANGVPMAGANVTLALSSTSGDGSRISFTDPVSVSPSAVVTVLRTTGTAGRPEGGAKLRRKLTRLFNSAGGSSNAGIPRAGNPAAMSADNS